MSSLKKMHKRLDYTTWARRIALRHPVYSYIGIQVNFWILAFVLLAIILHFSTLAVTDSYSLPFTGSLLTAVLTAIVIGLIFGTLLGLLDIIFEKGFFQQRSMGVIILLRGVSYYIVLIGMISFYRYVIWDLIFFDNSDLFRTDLSWRYFYSIVLVYTAVSATIISFVNQMNKKLGPGILIPMLLGRYRHPREEHRIFMFMDLKSSTTLAEKLGHIKYSSLIRDCFLDINRVLVRYSAEVYQYVGDEITVNWPVSEGLRDLACVEFFFSTRERFNQKRNYYTEKYGLVPEFKAGLHLGIVTAVEVGAIKRDIAYHGDTLNTAAGIRSLCNQYDKSLLTSLDVVKSTADLEQKYHLESLGQITLKGKDNPVEVFGIDSKTGR